MRKAVITFGIILAGVCSAGSISLARTTAGPDMRDSYTGPIDPITGEPTGSSEDTDEDTGEDVEVRCTDGSVYNRASNTYTYTFETGKVECSVANGMIVTGEVEIKVDGVSTVSFYKNGNKIDKIPNSVTEPGNYVFTYGDANHTAQVMSFQIINKKTGLLNQYIMPEGFYVDTVEIDSIEQNVGYSSVDMTQDGFYEINYINSSINMEYTLKVTVDHTPPQVTFKELDKNNKAKGPVTIKGLEDEDTVTVKFNGAKSSLGMNNKLTESGKYTVTVTDEAGNSVEKRFTILIYLNLSSTLFIAIILAVIIGVCVALYITRKRLRVR